MVREIKSAGVPARDEPYLARFLGTKNSKHDEYGAGLTWEWKVASGEHAGETTAKTTGVDPTPGNYCGPITLKETTRSKTGKCVNRFTKKHD